MSHRGPLPPDGWRQQIAEWSGALGQPLTIDAHGFRPGVPDQRLLQALFVPAQPATPGNVVERWDLYRTQRWVRLFEALQQSARRTAKALGYFEFNQLAHNYLLRHPPHSWDLALAGDGFLPWLGGVWAPMQPDQLGQHEVPREAFRECIALDLAEAKALRAAPNARLSLGPDVLDRAADRVLTQNHSATLLILHWGATGAGVTFRKRISPEYLMVLQRDGCVLMESVPASFCSLFRLTAGRRLASAIEEWQAAGGADAQLLQSLIVLGVRRHYWIGFS